MKLIRLTFIFIIILTLSLSTYYAIYYFTSQKPLSNIKNNTIIDKFGIKKIYLLQKVGGEEWFINMDDPNHNPRTDPQTTLIKNNNTMEIIVGKYKIPKFVTMYLLLQVTTHN